MTTNDATPREHVAMTILFVDRDKPDELIAANWEARKDRNSGLESQEELLRYAGNAIAAHSEYLWQAADDPAVMRQVADELNFYLLPDDGTSEKATQAAITILLTALLGPRPQESDDE